MPVASGTSGEYIAGLDLGQQSDYTALAIIERVTIPTGEQVTRHVETAPTERLRQSFPGRMEHAVYGAGGMAGYAASAGLPSVVKEIVTDVTRTEYHLRHLERPALGTPYPEIVSLVLRRLETPPLTGATALVVDATGVGRPVVDLLRFDKRLRAPMTPVTITGGDSVTHEGSEYHVPKRDLVGALQVLLQTGALKIAAGVPLAQTFLAEMLNFKATINLRGHDTYEAGAGGPGDAWREGKHDDLVLAVALACWYAERPQPNFRFLDY